jgi:hypothetical protein
VNEGDAAKRARLASDLVTLEEDLDAAESVHWGIMKAIESKHRQIEILNNGGKP